LLLLDEPTNHLDLDTIEWLEGYLQKQAVPMVIISHDRAFLDQLCTKIVETDMGVSRTFVGNYSEYVLAKASWIEAQYAAWEKQQKEIEQTRELINRLGAGVNSGRASSEEKVILNCHPCEHLFYSLPTNIVEQAYDHIRSSLCWSQLVYFTNSFTFSSILMA